ncbi:Aste57867_3421 [Aphanomyces stellatus]|uniref:Aste57867_3421 protein n=1 Tax=Aphanomyces stellatus TaxID=120398 RepID=A0A485KAF5_9STRA|nr:hypothetical protein As57867_003411 [Aphanomyces stellatus]VFT80587.1 Aste57867_3421 [Aphanomyces stellatus]
MPHSSIEWDIARDLPFLIANDMDLQTELTGLCDLMDDDTSSAGLSLTVAASAPAKPKRRRKPLTTPPGARNQHQARVRQEIMDLRDDVKTLVEELANMQAKASSCPPSSSSTSITSSPWQRLAILQSRHAQHALRENRRLRAAVDEQGSFMHKLAAFMRKRPRLDDDRPEEMWREYKLAAQQSLREMGIHAIADRQYSRKDTALLNAGLVGRHENFFSWGPLASSSEAVLEIRSHIQLAAPCAVISRAIWQVMSGHDVSVSSTASVTIERVDDQTIYEQFTDTKDDGVVCHANKIIKLYVEEKDDDDECASHVMVWRSVLDDARLPHMTHGTIEDESGWVVLTPIDDHSCWQSMVFHSRIDPSHANKGTHVDAIAASMRQLAVEDAPPPLGKFLTPCAVDAADVARPLHGPFLERGQQIERAVKMAVNGAVEHYNASQGMEPSTPT